MSQRSKGTGRGASLCSCVGSNAAMVVIATAGLCQSSSTCPQISQLFQLHAQGIADALLEEEGGMYL